MLIIMYSVDSILINTLMFVHLKIPLLIMCQIIESQPVYAKLYIHLEIIYNYICLYVKFSENSSVFIKAWLSHNSLFFYLFICLLFVCQLIFCSRIYFLNFYVCLLPCNFVVLVILPSLT